MEALRNQSVSLSCLLACIHQAILLGRKNPGPSPPRGPRLYREMYSHFRSTVDCSIDDLVRQWWDESIFVQERNASITADQSVLTLSMACMWSSHEQSFYSFAKRRSGFFPTSWSTTKKMFMNSLRENVSKIANKRVAKPLTRMLVCNRCRRCFGYKNPWEQKGWIQKECDAEKHWRCDMRCASGGRCNIIAERDVFMRVSFKIPQ